MTERQIERWWRLRRVQDKPSTLKKFCENTWRCMYYIYSFIFGVIILWDKPWFWDVKSCWHGYPHQAQHRRCEELLNAGIREIYLHCLGNAIIRGLNLALNLVNNSNNTLSYAINTSTVHLIDEYHPLYDYDEIQIERRNNSAVHIKINRTSAYDVDLAIDN